MIGFKDTEDNKLRLLPLSRDELETTQRRILVNTQSFLQEAKTATTVAVLGIVLTTAIIPVYATPSLGLQTNIASESEAPGSFPLVQNKQAAPLFVASSDWAGVLRAAGDLRADVDRVTGTTPVLNTTGAPAGKFAVIVGTLGKSPLVDGLVKSGELNADAISGKWESFLITTMTNPLPGMNQALVIAGSDKRGTIYGIYEISEQIGVSPWYWWADVPPQHHEELFIKAGTYVQGPPMVKYRGIFINDEEPCFGPWAREKFGGINSKMYAHMFELLLRLRANYLWPAMWGKAFNEDDPLNPKIADEYGIVMGTSHHEPMIRAQAEWGKHRKQYGNGEWNYLTNEEGLKKFWTDGIERNKNYESIVTVGMRGDGDVAMPDAGGPEANKKLLEKIITDQRQILVERMNPDVTKIPQLWALFTEVLPKAKTFEPDELRDVALKLDLPAGSLVNGSGIKFTNFDWPDDPKDAGQNLRASIGVWQWTKAGNEEVFPPDLATHQAIMVPLPNWSSR